MDLLFSHAIVRTPGPDAGGGLTTASLGRPDIPLLLAQHAAYIEILRALGLEVTVLPPLPGCPDAYFVEDAAVMTPEVAVITRPGAPSRRGEIESIESVLAKMRPVARIEAPGTLDGGDVLRVENRFYIGRSERTNDSGAGQLGRILEKNGYEWRVVPVGSGLHLKSSVNTLGGRDLVFAAGTPFLDAFEGCRSIVLDPGDDYAANALWINGTLLVPFGFPEARWKIEQLSRPVIDVAMTEMRKMDGGLTCLSLRF
ncbi:MAG: amidinotransferase [Acidobacteriota bacterium]|nr:amidinotransferase [Acidobacteriota bacterium]